MRPSEPKWRDPNVVTPPTTIERAEPSRGAPDAESKKEQLDRLHSMASGDETWDLSPNDITALRNLLDGHVVLLEALRACVREMEDAASLLEFFPDDYGEAINLARAAIQQAERT